MNQAIPAVQLLELVPVGVLLVQSDRRIVFANRAFHEVAHIPPERELAGLLPGAALGCIHALHRNEGCGSTPFCVYCGANTSILSALGGHGANEECRIARDPGEEPPALDLRVSTRPLPGDRGEPLIAFMVEDISNEKRREVLERSFFHDVLNTATSLRSTFAILNGWEDENGEIRRIGERTVEHLIDELEAQKLLSLAERGELVARPMSVAPMTILREVADSYKALARERDLRIAPDAEDVPAVTTDPVLLRRVLGNLIKNAIEATLTGDHITLSLRRTHDGVLFSVTNPQVMAPDVQAQVFQRTFSTKGSGRGIGTYSVRLLTSGYLGGTVIFRSQPDEGTVFELELPRNLTLSAKGGDISS